MQRRRVFLRLKELMKAKRLVLTKKVVVGRAVVRVEVLDRGRITINLWIKVICHRPFSGLLFLFYLFQFHEYPLKRHDSPLLRWRERGRQDIPKSTKSSSNRLLQANPRCFHSVTSSSLLTLDFLSLPVLVPSHRIKT